MKRRQNSSIRMGSNRKNPSSDVESLLRQRANLRHLVYFMEHDRSLNAEGERINCLRTMLDGIEERIGASATVMRR